MIKNNNQIEIKLFVLIEDPAFEYEFRLFRDLYMKVEEYVWGKEILF